MKYINLLIPPFLQRIDNHLMLHSPHVWRTRVHFVSFYALVAPQYVRHFENTLRGGGAQKRVVFIPLNLRLFRHGLLVATSG
jgi:hypothetical protein